MPVGVTVAHRESNIRTISDMMRAAWIFLAVVLTSSSGHAVTPEQCRFIEARPEREACYQRQEAARLSRQKANEAQLAKAIRGICRGC